MEWVDQLSDDVVAFLSEGTRTGMLGYLASDGRPLVAPVWFVVDKGELVFNTGKDTATGGRYMGADRAEEYGRRNGVPGELVVRIRPTKVRHAFDLAN